MSVTVSNAKLAIRKVRGCVFHSAVRFGFNNGVPFV